MSDNHIPTIAIACVDARLHDPSIVPQIEELLGSDSVYLETMPGPEVCVLGRKDDPDGNHFSALISDLQLLIEAKGVNDIAIIGHCDCAGHPVSDEQHVIDVQQAAEKLRGALPTAVTVHPLLAYPPERSGGVWSVERLEE